MAVVGSLYVAPGLDGLYGALLAALMIAIATEDARSYIIANELTGAAFALALLRAATTGFDPGLSATTAAIAGALATSVPLWILMVIYRRIRGRDGLGLGDVKLAAVAGAWLDWQSVLAAVQIAALVALGAYLLMSILRRIPLKGTAALPFGLFFAPAIWAGWLIEAVRL